MSDKKRQLTDIVEILGSLIRCIALKRALNQTCAEPHLNFWRLIYGNLMDQAVLDWCKLFGSDDADRQPVHWKNISTDQDGFRKGLLAEVGMNVSQWTSYWDNLKKYRDLNVAHHDPRRESISHYPMLEPALNLHSFIMILFVWS